MKNINNIAVYATIEEVDTYLAMKWGASSWATVSEDIKKVLIVTATKEIDRHDFQGLPVSPDQELKFPRVLCYCCNDCQVYPEKELIQCVSEIAFALSNTIADAPVTPNAEKIKSMSVGDTSITYKDGVTIETDIISSVSNPIVIKYLKEYLRGNIKVIL